MKTSELQASAISVLQQLVAQGHETYFAGGCVRDSLLDKTALPKDYDIATSATPEQVLKVFPKGETIGAHFGVILVRKNGHHFEIATFRTDGDYLDGRHPSQVTFSTPQEDAQRRDFTINALFYNPLNQEVIDYVNGRADLAARHIRAVGAPSLRFQEDGLRLMRAIRFATVLDFDIHPDTWSAIRNHASMLRHIAIERINVEFTKTLLSPHRARGFQLLTDSGLIKQFLPEVLELIGCEQPPQWHPEGDVFTHTKIMLDMLPNQAPIELVLSVLLHDIGKPATYQVDETGRIRFNGHDRVGSEMSRRILNRLKYSNAIIDQVVPMVDNHMNFMNVQQMRTAKVKRFMARPTYEMEMELHRVDCASSNGLTENYDYLRSCEEKFAAEPLIPKPLVTGKDLIDLGLKPGALFREILTTIQTEQLENRLHSKEEVITYIKAHWIKK